MLDGDVKVKETTILNSELPRIWELVFLTEYLCSTVGRAILLDVQVIMR